MTIEKGGGFFMHCPQTLEYSDENGIAHILHDGPVYLFILDQHEAQIGE
jgi:hypothetical protein